MRYEIALLITVLLFATSCSPLNSLNKLNKEGYTFILNNTDTLTFDRLYLDNNYDHSFEINRKEKTIQLKTNSELEQVLSIQDIEKMYSRDSVKIAFIILNGDILGTSVSDERVYFQYSLVNEVERIKKGTLDGVGFHPPQGDVLIIK